MLLGALAFRLAFFADARFAGDEAWQWHTALGTARFHLFPVTGVSVTGQDVQTPGGLYHLLMALPLLAWSRPEAAAGFVVLLNVAALAVGWRLLRGQYGPRAALGALLVAAVNPFSVFLGDRQWNPDLLVPLGMVWLGLLAAAVRDGGPRAWGWLAGLLAVAPQIHLGCTHLVFLTLAVVAAARPAVRWKAVLAGGAAGVATYLPYFVVDGLKGFQNTAGLLGHVASAKAPLGEMARAVYHQVLYGAGDLTYQVAKGFWFPMTEWEFLGGAEGRRLYGELLGLPGAGGWALAAGLGIGLLVSAAAHLHLLAATGTAWARGLRDAVRRDPLAAAAVLNLPVLLLSFGLARKAFYPHYTIVVFPLALVAVAGLLARLPGRVAVAVVGALAAVAVTHGVLVARTYQRDEAPVSVHVAVEAARIIGQDARGKPVAVEFAVPRTRMGSYPVVVVAGDLWGTPIVEDGRSSTRYRIVPPGSREVEDATAAWDLGGALVVRRGPAP